MGDLEKHFEPFRKHIIGNEVEYITSYGTQKMLYLDWVASGRLYQPIENALCGKFGSFVANTHTQTSESGTRMTLSYHQAHKIIKEHVHVGANDVIITSGSGMTSVVNKLQRILGLKKYKSANLNLPENERPVVFLTHMEHHSNQTSWYESIADVVVLKPNTDLLVDPQELRIQLEKYQKRSFKIGAFTACSNVTGIITPYHELARIMHEYGGVCFVDFAASAPYVDINMHPKDELEKLDAIFFSPHKFLGGPGSSGVLIFDSNLYKNEVPDDSGGGTLDWTNPWGNYKYVDDIEVREDGGTPGFLQAIRTALAIKMKEKMDVAKIKAREDELLAIAFSELDKIKGVKILADKHRERLGVISFYHPDIHYNLIVKLLSDRFGIQVRGGCACAGTYGHYLLEVSYEKSQEITEKIRFGDLSQKPGWVRVSLHPTLSDADVYYFANALREVVKNHVTWGNEYVYNKKDNEFQNCSEMERVSKEVEGWFLMD
jgi:selenocysteine lyase/cysteine desulfurase